MDLAARKKKRQPDLLPGCRDMVSYRLFYDNLCCFVASAHDVEACGNIDACRAVDLGVGSQTSVGGVDSGGAVVVADEDCALSGSDSGCGTVDFAYA